MASAQLAMAGGRLAYVVVPIKGKVKRVRVRPEAKEAGKRNDGTIKFIHEFRREVVEEPGGFMVYFPKGHVLRMTERELRRYKLNRPAKMVDLSGTLSGKAGKLLAAQTEQGMREGFTELERFTMTLATARTGPQLLLREEKIPDEFGEEPIHVTDFKKMDFDGPRLEVDPT